MLHIYICEDDKSYRDIIEKRIKDTVLIEDYDMIFELAATTPQELISCIINKNYSGMYFLDVDLNASINGIELADKIREYDPRGFIVFITAHGESLSLTFKYKVEAMDFIVKSPDVDIHKRIQECLLSANEKYSRGVSELQKNLVVNVDGRKTCIRHEDILFIETTDINRKLVVYAVDRRVVFNAQLKDIEKMLSEDFYRCHKSAIVNLNMVDAIDNDTGNLILKGGSRCPFGARKKGRIVKFLEK